MENYLQIAKVHTYGVDNSLFEFLMSNQNDKKQWVKVGNTSNVLFTVKTGVLQGIRLIIYLTFSRMMCIRLMLLGDVWCIVLSMMTLCLSIRHLPVCLKHDRDRDAIKTVRCFGNNDMQV